MILNPAWRALVAQNGSEFTWAQVLVRRVGKGFELRHLADRAIAEGELRAVTDHEMVTLGQFTENGAFRPLSGAPNLRRGWRHTVAGEAELELVLNQLYPGAVADWYAAQQPKPPVTDYREFANRQTGMYRTAQMLSDEQAAVAIRAGCHASVCLKRRLWTVPGLEIDPTEGKSVIPCLEPCAVMLEFARKAMRIEQGEKISAALAEDDLETLKVALQCALAQPDPTIREGDTNQPGNPRRLRLALEKLEVLPKKVTGVPNE